MKHYEITTIALILIGLSALIVGYISSDILKQTPAQTESLVTTVVADELKVAAAS